MRSLSLALALAAWGSAAAAQPPAAAPPSGAELAGLIEAEARSRVPMDLQGGMRLVAIRAEGSTLVWTLEVPAAEFESARSDPAGSGAAFRTGFCRSQSRGLFERGVALLVHVTNGTGASVPFPLITDCPASE